MLERRDTDLFRCYLFIKESDFDKKVKGHPQKLLDSLEINIKLPRELSFDIASYAKELSNFILGIAKFHEGSLIEAKQLFEEQFQASQSLTQNKSIFKLASYERNQESD